MDGKPAGSHLIYCNYCKKFKNEEFFSKYFLNEHAVLPSCAGAFFEGADRGLTAWRSAGSRLKTSFPGLDLTPATFYKNSVASVAQSDRAGAF